MYLVLQVLWVKKVRESILNILPLPTTRVSVTRALVDAGLEVVPFSRVKKVRNIRIASHTQRTLIESKNVAGVPTQELGSLVGFDAIVSTVGMNR